MSKRARPGDGAAGGGSAAAAAAAPASKRRASEGPTPNYLAQSIVALAGSKHDTIADILGTHDKHIKMHIWLQYKLVNAMRRYYFVSNLPMDSATSNRRYLGLNEDGWAVMDASLGYVEYTLAPALFDRMRAQGWDLDYDEHEREDTVIKLVKDNQDVHLAIDVPLKVVHRFNSFLFAGTYCVRVPDAALEPLSHDAGVN